MKKYLLYPIFAIHSLFAIEQNYFSLLEQLKLPSGSWEKGEIEVVVDPAEINKISEIQKNRLLKKGFSESEAKEFSSIGIVAEDHYWVWLRDAVYFPNKVAGTYDRLLWKVSISSGNGGVAVLPILQDGRISLNLNYRHATRSWELELPRGGKLENETNEAAALRELKEETGQEVSSIHFLGNMAPDTGTLSSVVPVFLGRVSSKGSSDQEYSEAIAGVVSFTMEELNAGLVHGYLEVPIHGKKEKVPLRDAFLTFALLQAKLRKML